MSQFITNLYQLTEHCKYGNLRYEMIRDHIIEGIRDSALPERLQLDPDLTLEKVKKLVCQHEAVHEHQQFLSEKSSKGAMAETVLNRKPPRGPTQPLCKSLQQKRQQVCTRCGKGLHSRQAGPLGVICQQAKLPAPTPPH